MSGAEEERSKEVVRQYARALSAGDIDSLVALFEPGTSIQGVLRTGTPEEMRPVWSELQSGLAANLEIEDMVAEGSTVAVRYTETGTSRAPFFGTEPTGKSFSVLVGFEAGAA